MNTNSSIHVLHLTRSFLIAFVLAMSATPADAFPIVTNAVEAGGDGPPTAQFTGQTFTGPAIGTYTVPLFGNDVKAFADRVHEWNAASATVPLPSYLVGGEYILIRNDNRENAAYRLEVTLSEPALVYLLIDNRLTDGNNANPPENGNTFDLWTGMSWMATNGFAAVLTGQNRNANSSVPDEVGADEAADGDIDQWASVYSKSVPAGTFTLFQADNGTRNIYGVVVTRPPGSPNSPPEIASLIPTNNTGFYAAGGGLGFTATTVAPNAIESTNISVLLNGIDVSASLVLGGNPTSRTVAYNSLQANTLYHAQIVVSDQAGRTTTNTLSFDTFDAAAVTIVDAEDYDYQGGQFLTAPPPGGYVGLLGTPEVDFHDDNAIAPDVDYRTDFVGMAAANDRERADFIAVGAIDQMVNQIQDGDWLNYTREFNGNYQVYLRASSTAAQLVRLDRVIGAGASNQTTFPLGIFAIPNTGGAANFAYVPLTGASGNAVAISLSGTNTLRLTALSANYNLQWNYLLLAPSAIGRPPYVSAALPAFGATNITPDVAIRITIANGGNQVVPGSVVLVINTSNVVANVSASPTGDGVVVTYDPPGFLATNTVYNATLTFTGTNPGAYLYQWTFTTVPSITVIPPIYSTPLASGQGSGFRLKVRKAPNLNALGAAFTLANTALRAEQQLADVLIDPDTTVPYVNEAGGPNNDGLATNGVINYQHLGGMAGYFPADALLPHIDPAVFGDPNNIAMEVTAFLELPAGGYRLGVRSDDGFKLTTGPVITDTNLVLGILEGGRGDGLPGGATEFDVLVASGGVYPFRLIWYEGNSGASLEFYSVDRATSQRTLINDSNAPGSIKAFLSRPNLIFVPTVAITNPTNGTIFPDTPTNITIAADASIVSGRIALVEFFHGATNKIGEATNSPYSLVWSNVAEGRYTLTARATDTNGLSTVSAPVDVILGRPLIINAVEAGGDGPPTAQFTGQTFTGPAIGTYTVPLFGNDVKAFADRVHEWNAASATVPLPSYLVGGEYILIRNDNRENAAYRLEVTLSEPALVYLLIDNRLTDGNNANPPENGNTFDLWTGMSWMATNGFAAVLTGQNRNANSSVPDEVGADEAADGDIDQWASVYSKSVPAGTFTLFQADNGTRNIYGVVVKRPQAAQPVFNTPTLTGTNLTITWSGGGRLQEAGEVTGPWNNVPGNPSGSFNVQTTEARKFYQVVSP